MNPRAARLTTAGSEVALAWDRRRRRGGAEGRLGGRAAVAGAAHPGEHRAACLSTSRHLDLGELDAGAPLVRVALASFRLIGD